MKYKYIVIFPIPDPYLERIIEIMDIIALYTGIEPPYKRLVPHITFHRPIENIEEEVIKDFVKSMVLQMRRTRITISDLFPFGKQYIVFPVHATRAVAEFWVGINYLLSRLKEYVHGEFDHDNTLHISVAEKTSDVFDEVWPTIKKMVSFDPMNIPVGKIAIYRKPIDPSENGNWELVVHYLIDWRKTKSG
ncbi:MAG TPA: hypothetical protein VL576_00120 [Candidatus Paceibacterota bacterium]|jgi:hypothetical protein|nr:hypothetical protein [Candidatus Paceibacterota bacterium]